MKKIEKVLKIKLRKNEVPAGFGARVEILRPTSFFWRRQLESLRVQLYYGYAYRIETVLKYGLNSWTGRVEKVNIFYNDCKKKWWYKVFIQVDGRLREGRRFMLLRRLPERRKKLKS